MKKLSDFTAEALIKSVNEDKMVEMIVETVAENNLSENETSELIDELFGIGATMKRVGSKITHPFKVGSAAVKGAAARVKEKVSSAVGKVKAKSAEMDAAAAKKLNQAKAAQGKKVAAVYKKSSGGMDRPTPVKTMTAADKERLAARRASSKATPAKPKMSTGAVNAKAKTGKPKAPQATSTLAKEKSKPTMKTEPTVLKNKTPKVNPTRPVAKKKS